MSVFRNLRDCEPGEGLWYLEGPGEPTGYKVTNVAYAHNEEEAIAKFKSGSAVQSVSYIQCLRKP